MHLTYRNVNNAFVGLVKGIHSGTIPTKRCDSRNGPVMMIEEPVTLTYTHPLERVLFNSVRDANPFFHLYEAMWMLAGRNDVATLAYYAANIASYSDDGVTLNGAYGYRWRNWATLQPSWVLNEDNGTLKYQIDDSRTSPSDGMDQLRIIINHLKEKPESRRAILQMWQVGNDLLKIDTSRDVCCNLSVMFAIRENVLDMTVTNRSNDMIWGTLGANVVHFSFLQEYMAAKIGVGVGVYNQFSNNLHVYEANWKPEEWLAAKNAWGYSYYFSHPNQMKRVPLVKDPEKFDEELYRFVEHHSGKPSIDDLGAEWSEPFLEDAHIMLTAFALHKVRDYHGALNVIGDMEASDWKIVAQEWLERRAISWEKKEKSSDKS